jgi:hypothetical protein
VCDEQKQESVNSDEDLDEMFLWRKWRAPKLIRMQPSGNSPYLSEAAWLREDEGTTERLLNSFSKIFVQFLEIDLDKTAGMAHVTLAKKGWREASRPERLVSSGSSKSLVTEIRSPYKQAIRQALISLGRTASAKQVAAWIDEKVEDVQFEHLAKAYGRRIVLGNLYRTEKKFRSQLDRDVSKIRKLFK